MLQLDVPSPRLPRGEELAARLETEGHLLLPCAAQLQDRIAELWRAGGAFFQLPGAVKLPNVLPNDDGYHAIGREYSDTPERPDLAESFWARPIHARETWRFPDEAGRTLHRAALDAAAALETALRPITEALARHYAGPAAWAPELAFACGRASHLQFNRYLPGAHGREILTDAH